MILIQDWRPCTPFLLACPTFIFVIDGEWSARKGQRILRSLRSWNLRRRPLLRFFPCALPADNRNWKDNRASSPCRSLSLLNNFCVLKFNRAPYRVGDTFVIHVVGRGDTISASEQRFDRMLNSRFLIFVVFGTSDREAIIGLLPVALPILKFTQLRISHLTNLLFTIIKNACAVLHYKKNKMLFDRRFKIN